MIYAEISRKALLDERAEVFDLFIADGSDFEVAFALGVLAAIDWINEGSDKPSDILKDSK